MQETRVVITGMGVISPCGLDTASLWANLTAGRSGIGPIMSFDTGDFEVRIAGEVWDFDPQDYMPAKEVRRTDRFTQYALAALEQALAQSALKAEEMDAYQVGVLVGSGVGGIRTYTQELDGLRRNGPRRVQPFPDPFHHGRCALGPDCPADWGARPELWHSLCLCNRRGFHRPGL